MVSFSPVSFSISSFSSVGGRVAAALEHDPDGLALAEVFNEGGWP